MEEIKINPSIAIEKTLITIGIILIIIIITLFSIFNLLNAIPSILGIFLPYFIISISSLIHKKYRTYTISDNEITNSYQFISKTSKVYRMDQITSITLTQSWVQRIFNLGHVSFGIFGQHGLPNPNAQNQNQQIQVSNKIISITEFENIFDTLLQKLNISDNQIIYEDNPSLRPVKFWIKFWSFFGILSIIGVSTGIYLGITIDTDWFITSLLSAIPLFILSIILIALLFDKSRIKSESYTLTNNSAIDSYSYILGKSKIIIPFSKITNTEVNKNLISYSLFKIGSVKVFTGGNNDPYFNLLEKYNEFINILSKQYKNLSTPNTQRITTKEEKGYLTKPSSSFFLTFLFWTSVIFILIIITGIIVPELMYISKIYIYFFIIALIFRYILWKNTSYEFFENKIIDKSGVINIKTKEIYFKNIKHIKLSKSFIFDRILNQGTIHIYTPGTSIADNKINSIKKYKKIYKELKETLLDY